jgi:hypothetical protein
MRHTHLVSTLVLIALFSMIFSLGYYFGASYKNNKYYNEGFSAGFSNAMTSLSQNNIIPTPTELKTANAIIKQKKENQFVVEILPNISAPIINPQDKIKTLNINVETTFCKLIQLSPENIPSLVENQAPMLTEKKTITADAFDLEQKIQITTINDILSNNTLEAKEICLYP